MSGRFVAEGGKPITAEVATALRQLIFGSSAIPIRAEWTQTPFLFGPANEELAYGLRSPRNATRGLLSVVQGFVLKYLLFSRRCQRVGSPHDNLLASAELQRDALINALVEILRTICERKEKVTVVLPSAEGEIFVPHSVTYFHDSVTEKLYLFALSPHDELEFFMKRHYKQFTEQYAPGSLLFLYSAVLTRSMGKVRSDLDSTKSVPLTAPNNEEGSLMIVTLLLTGRATPYIHNGVINVGDDNSYALPQYGILSRATIGLLIWGNDNHKTYNQQAGSRLKTPNFPIWVTSCAGHYGVLFNRNPDLLRNYHAESCFDVNYYSCSGHQIQMTIDNRSFNEQACGMLERQSSSATENTSLTGTRPKDDCQSSGSCVGAVGYAAGASASSFRSAVCGTGSVNEAGGREEAGVHTPLQRLIHTKWEEAQLRFTVPPSMLSYLFNTVQ